MTESDEFADPTNQMSDAHAGSLSGEATAGIALLGAALSKSRYLAGLQCPRRLWLTVNDPLPASGDAPNGVAQAGIAVGIVARGLYPNGITVAPDPPTQAAAVAQTQALMSDPAVPAIFEAAISAGGVDIRADILARDGDRWRLIEVKSGSSAKDHYLDDVAVQAWALSEAGITVSGADILHINTACIRGPDGIDVRALFSRVDVTAKVQARLGSIQSQVSLMHGAVSAPEMPDTEPGGQCTRPYACEFWDRCTTRKPPDWVRKLPRLSASQATRLEALGVEAISAIPTDFPLAGKQAVIRDVLVNGQPYVAPDLARLLHNFGPPALYLDFEAMAPAIPLYPSTRPFQALPFQWSLHEEDEQGQLVHQEFLAAGDSDPRRSFAESLIGALKGNDLLIVVYSPYEQTRLRELTALFPDLKPELDRILGRLVDLLPVVRAGVYFAEFDFTHSIKKVAPALSPGFGYGDLPGIADGEAAASAFVAIASGSVSDPSEIGNLRSSLLAYCCWDTLAMVEVHRALRRLARLEAT